ncbi:MAG TPA: bifunctional methylenetetrahydrofolate dehydrogenase/methenyltetrahydrofolate cyclohydrolase FolD [Myxococcota bacterium]|nr:bifunctional methylenetetrahydrofolate dehydrogenase/methenyltetrahydrofolate cyclohydrolase FolD [Myxococcota bacterium]HQK49729.1 bifunctional methylenetetrahydrofolate dehydrogenase/methenyltetrahydrofolate cyclohydrolase FolD [Myxococcota bacterium]
MAARILDGKSIAATVRGEVKEAVDRLHARGVFPSLHVVLVGDDPASAVYVRNKARACEEVGIRGVTHRLPATTTEAEVLALLHRLNGDPEVDGVLVQLPLPPHISADRVIDAQDPARDVDGFHPVNLGRLVSGREGLVACTPAGCMRLIQETGIRLQGKRAVVLGRSLIVGKPMALLLLAAHATVTICHSRTRDLPARVAEADVLVAAIGQARLVRGEWIQEGTVVIDVGMNRDEEGRLCGDVDFEGASRQASFITPVPGGVGPMTIAFLLRNTLIAACARRGLPPPF